MVLDISALPKMWEILICSFHVIFTYGFWYICIAQDVGDIGMFISQFKQRLKDCMTQRWHANITESSVCDTYKEFISLLNVEKY